MYRGDIWEFLALTSFQRMVYVYRSLEVHRCPKKNELVIYFVLPFNQSWALMDINMDMDINSDQSYPGVHCTETCYYMVD